MTFSLFPDLVAAPPPTRRERAPQRPRRPRKTNVATIPMFTGHPKHKRSKKDRESVTVYEAVLILRKAGCHVFRAGAGRHRVGSAEVDDLGLIDIAIGELETQERKHA